MSILSRAVFWFPRKQILFLLLIVVCVSSVKLLKAQATAASPSSQIVARAGDNVITEEDFADLRVLNNSVLDTPLSPAEQEQARQNILHQFQSAPAAFTKSREQMQQLAALYRHGTLAMQTAIAMKLWALWNSRAEADPHAKWWVGLVRQHNPPIVASGGLIITHLQLNGLFADDDWVAQTAGFPVSTEASRAAYMRDLKSKFATMSQEEKVRLARADVRWFDLQNPILDHSDLRQIAVNEVHEHVHGPQDVYTEARNLEDIGVRFNNEMAQFGQNMAAIGGLDFKTKSNIQNLNFADRKFWGKGP